MRHIFRLLGSYVEGSWTLPKEEAHHAFKVLRLQAGSRVEICDGAGRVDICEIEIADKSQPGFKVLESKVFKRADRKTVLICPALDHGELDESIAGYVETGIDEILVYLPRGADKKRIGEKKTIRWEQRVRGGTKQCKRAFLPHLQVFDSLDSCLSILPKGFQLFVGDPNGFTASKAMEGARANVDTSCLAFVCGSEHGLSEQELEATKGACAKSLSLGPHVLRAKTAALLGSFFLQQVRACL